MFAKRPLIVCALLALAAMGSARSTRADTLTMTNTSTWDSDFTWINLQTGSDYGNWSGTEPAGAIAWTVNAPPATDQSLYNVITQDGSITSVVTYCIEIGQNVYVGQQQTWTTGTLVGAPIPNAAGTVSDPPNPLGGLTPAQANMLYALEEAVQPYTFDAHTDQEAAAAAQLAIWEIVYDTSPHDFDLASGNVFAVDPLTSGQFQVGPPAGQPASDFGGVVSMADADLLAAKGYEVANPSITYPGPNSGVVALLSGSNQDQVLAFVPPLGTGHNTPLPPVAAMGAVMLAVAGLGRWSFRRIVRPAYAQLRRPSRM